MNPLTLADELLCVEFSQCSDLRDMFRTHLLLVGAALHAIAWRDAFGVDGDSSLKVEELAINLCLGRQGVPEIQQNDPVSDTSADFDLAGVIHLVDRLLRNTPEDRDLVHRFVCGIQRPGG